MVNYQGWNWWICNMQLSFSWAGYDLAQVKCIRKIRPKQLSAGGKKKSTRSAKCFVNRPKKHQKHKGGTPFFHDMTWTTKSIVTSTLDMSMFSLGPHEDADVEVTTGGSVSQVGHESWVATGKKWWMTNGSGTANLLICGHWVASFTSLLDFRLVTLHIGVDDSKDKWTIN